jgi:hypothetical protein
VEPQASTRAISKSRDFYWRQAPKVADIQMLKLMRNIGATSGDAIETGKLFAAPCY